MFQYLEAHNSSLTDRADLCSSYFELQNQPCFRLAVPCEPFRLALTSLSFCIAVAQPVRLYSFDWLGGFQDAPGDITLSIGILVFGNISTHPKRTFWHTLLLKEESWLFGCSRRAVGYSGGPTHWLPPRYLLVATCKLFPNMSHVLFSPVVTQREALAVRWHRPPPTGHYSRLMPSFTETGSSSF